MSSACFIVQPFYKISAQKGQSKQHCVCIKEKQNNSSQSFLRNPSTLKLPLAHVCLAGYLCKLPNFLGYVISFFSQTACIISKRVSTHSLSVHHCQKHKRVHTELSKRPRPRARLVDTNVTSLNPWALGSDQITTITNFPVRIGLNITIYLAKLSFSFLKKLSYSFRL